MAAKRFSFDALRAYLPDGSFEKVMPLITYHHVHLIISKERQTKLGDFRHAYSGNNHRITVNGNLNKYSFLITLIHELSHLLAYQRYGHRIQPHGKEWKFTYSQELMQFLQPSVFPDDITLELQKMLHNPAASSSAEDGLQRALRRYETVKDGFVTVEEVHEGTSFKLADGRSFVRGQKMRKRIKCLQIPGNKVYLFHPLYEVQIA